MTGIGSATGNGQMMQLRKIDGSGGGKRADEVRGQKLYGSDGLFAKPTRGNILSKERCDIRIK